MGNGKKIAISTGAVVAGFFAFMIIVGSLASVDEPNKDQASATGNNVQQPSTQQPMATTEEKNDEGFNEVAQTQQMDGGTVYINSLRDIYDDYSDLSFEFTQVEAERYFNGEIDDTSMGMITDNYLSEFQSVIDRTNDLRPPVQFSDLHSNALEVFTLTVAMLEQFHLFLETNDPDDGEEIEPMTRQLAERILQFESKLENAERDENTMDQGSNDGNLNTISADTRIAQVAKDCTRDHPYVTYPDYETYVSTDCLMEKVESVQDCHDFTSIITVETTVIDGAGNERKVTVYFDETYECVTQQALKNHDLDACNTLDSNIGCVTTYAKTFEEPEACAQATNSLECFKSVSLTLGSNVCNLTESESNRVECGKNYIVYASPKEYSTKEISERCSENFPLRDFFVNQVACKLDSLGLEGFSSTDLLTWRNDNGDLLACPISNDIKRVYGQQKTEDYCIGSIGTYLQDLSICDQSGEAQAECYSFIAVTEDFVDLDTCDELDTGTSFCYMHVAYRLDDIGICDELDSNERENCINLVSKKV